MAVLNKMMKDGDSLLHIIFCFEGKDLKKEIEKRQHK